ncbi:MAG: DNA mismatch repair protein MutS [Clostridiaceae bacterium]
MNELDYVILIAIIIIIVNVAAVIKKRRSIKKLRQTLEMKWGKKPDEKYRDEDMTAVRSYYENLKEKDCGRLFLDDITWNDLEMDKVFMRLNSTQSTAGEEYLYALMREPLTDCAVLDERRRLIQFFQTNPSERRQLQFLFARLGKSRFSGVSNYFLSSAEYKPFRHYKYISLVIVLVLSPVLMVFNLNAGILLLIASFIANMTTYYKAKNEFSAQLDSMSYMVNLINYSRKAANFDIPELKEYTDRLKNNALKFKGTGIKSFYQIFYNTQDPYFEYFKIIFLVELIAYESINKKIIRHRNELRTLYETIGLLDSMLAAASFRESVPFYTAPDMYTADKKRRPSISFKEIYHPMVDEPVTNSLSINRPALITGSNASGKSTFLKTAAINAIFAQTISTCLASKYESSYFRIYTSMALKDDLLHRESYYIAEIRSLKRILDSLNDQYPLFCVIDEVLRGTNTIERIAASSEVMRYLSGKNCICLTATHDIELVSILDGLFDNYHFQESFVGNTITFDYKIYPGKSNTRNAIKLLEIMGYPEDTVKAARSNAERFEQKGGWV